MLVISAPSSRNHNRSDSECQSHADLAGRIARRINNTDEPTTNSASVLPDGKTLGAQPGGELRLHPGGDSMRQAREPFHEIEPESAAMRADEPSGLRSRTVSLEARLGR